MKRRLLLLVSMSLLFACSDNTSLPGGGMPDAAVPPDPNAPDAMPPRACVNDAECDDSVDCTTESCVDGFCAYDSDNASCDDNNACDGVEACVPDVGCVDGTPPAPTIECRSDLRDLLALGQYHSCALDALGYMRCWGAGFYGQLGYEEWGEDVNIGKTADRLPETAGAVSTPNGEFAPLRYVVQMAPGSNHTCALLNTGEVLCWGSHNEGQLGYGLLGDSSADPDPEQPKLDRPPMMPVDIGGKAVQIASRNFHTCVILDSGNVRCWGRGGGGQLGYITPGNVGDDETPASMGDVDLGGVAVQIATGSAHTCALLDTGNVRCWGLGEEGQLGYGDTEDVGDDEVPSVAGDVPLGGTAVQVAAGGLHSCALLDNGEVRCWGSGEFGALGYGNNLDVGNATTPEEAGPVPLGGTAIQVVAGGQHSCALLDNGGVRCWGDGMRGAHGYATLASVGLFNTPADLGDIDLGGPAQSIAAGGFHTCALMVSGEVRCWGYGVNGQLGYGNENTIGDDESPSAAGTVPLGLNITNP